MKANYLLWLVALGCAPIAYYWFQVARRKREVIRMKLRRVGIGLTCYATGIFCLPRFGYNQFEGALFGGFAGLALAFLLVRPPKVDRRIPTWVRRAVIERDLKGERFDPKLHDLDHIVPFSKGGDHSVENLRVLPKAENRRRGARMPKLRDFR